MKPLPYLTIIAIVCLLCSCASQGDFTPKTTVEIKGDNFYINGKPSYEGCQWKGNSIEGLLLNSRMVQGVFDDENPETAKRWAYPDDGTWSADRNTDEFVIAMEEWASYGLNSFTINLQGGSPMGYGNKNWKNTAFDAHGFLKPSYTSRLSRIIEEADALNMVVILGYFYFGQDQFLADEQAVINATTQATHWILDRGYTNVLVEVANECDIKTYDHSIIMQDRIHELIQVVQSISKDGHRLLVSTSYAGNRVPKANVVKVSDYILIHGNSIKNPQRVAELILETKAVEGYKGCPIVINEDDHYDFDNDENNFSTAIKAHVSWGYFDYRRDGESFENGFQSVPIDWSINSERKLDFFKMVKEVTGK